MPRTPDLKKSQRKRIRRYLRKKYGDHCHWCEKPMLFGKESFHGCRDYATIEHLIQRCLGGTNDLANLRLCCVRCNK